MTLLFVLTILPADACSLLPPDTLTVDPNVADADVPLPPAIVAVDVVRGHNGNTSCDDLGFITITVARPDDDSDTHDDVGYAFELASGTLPDDFHLPSGTTGYGGEVSFLGPELNLHWIDGATNDQEAFDFVLALRSVDIAGNVGDPVEVQIADDGSGGDGESAVCACAQGGATSITPMAVFLVWVVLRRPARRIRG